MTFIQINHPKLHSKTKLAELYQLQFLSVFLTTVISAEKRLFVNISHKTEKKLVTVTTLHKTFCASYKLTFIGLENGN